MNDYEARREARIERLRARAERKRAEGEARINGARRIADGIPLGQPILVGHHSERRHRRDIDRIQGGFSRGYETLKKADELDRRASAAESNTAISSDDPEAIAKLREWLAELEAKRETMRRTNAAWRKAGRPALGDDEGWAKIAGILGVTLEAAIIRRLRFWREKDPAMVAVPFERFQFSNLGGNIKRVKGRIALLEREQKREPSERMVGDVRIVENVEANRLQLFFPGKPDDEMRGKLKRYGFRWSPSEKAWQRQLNNAARMSAKWVLGE